MYVVIRRNPDKTITVSTTDERVPVELFDKADVLGLAERVNEETDTGIVVMKCGTFPELPDGVSTNA